MSFSKNARQFGEELLRLYLGKYTNRFKTFNDDGEILLLTDPYPVLVAHLAEFHKSIEIILYEYLPIEEDSFYYVSNDESIFNWHCCEIVTIPIEDPQGIIKMEKAITNSFLTGTKS